VGRFSKKGWRDLTTGPHTTLRDIASAYQTDERYAADVIQLAFLAPDVTARILAGTQPFDLTLHALLCQRRRVLRQKGARRPHQADDQPQRIDTEIGERDPEGRGVCRMIVSSQGHNPIIGKLSPAP